MHVKLEPSDQLELPVNLITDIESDLFREHLFGNLISSNSDISESSSDDDHLSRLSLSYEPLADPFGTGLPSSMWEQRSSRSSSSSSSFDQALADMESQPNSFSDFAADDLDLEGATCSPHDVIMSPLDMKEEMVPSAGEMDPASMAVHINDANSIWDLLCSNDVKPNIKTLDTPPVTPPEGNSLAGDSPPTSPYGAFGSTVKPPTPPPPPPPTSLLPTTAVITVTSVNPTSQSPPTPPRKKIALAPKIPFKIVTTITANETNGNLGNPRAIKIQPKSASACKPLVTVPKFTEVKSGHDRTLLKVNKHHLLQKPLVLTTVSTSQHSTPVTNSITIPTSAKMSSCPIIPDQKPTRLPPLAPALNPSLKNNSMAELRAVKRQQRMIKNRESASLSRKRKKEYMQGLEDRVRELDLENAKLRAENERLLRRVTSLENEKVIMRATRFPIKRSSTALLGFAFLFLFNISPFMNLFKGRTDVFPAESWKAGDVFKPGMNSLESETPFHRRSLLSLPSFDPLPETPLGEAPPPTNVSHICPLNFNSTESIRIENDLRDWFDLSQKDWSSGPPESRGFDASFRAPRKSDHGAPKEAATKVTTEGKERALAAPITSAAYQYLYHSDQHSHEPLPKRRLDSSRDIMAREGSIQSLLESIDRRNDTYYVVSLTADHLLLPASAHNASARPKMSLLVPTPKSLNDRDDHIGIMQIDCEVTHTRVVRWREIPEVSAAPSVPSTDVLPEAPINATDPKRAFRRDKISLKKKKRKKI